MNHSKIPSSHLKELFELLSSVDSESEAKMLFSDLLTPKELETLAERWQLVKMLSQNKTQREVSAKLKISISKVTRGSKQLQYGKGGFDHFLKKLSRGRR